MEEAEEAGGSGNTAEAYARVLDMLEKAYELDATCAECVVAMGIVNNLLGRQSQAMELLSKGMAMKPQYPDPYEALVDIYLDGNRFEKATDVALKWREIEPDQTDAEEALAQIYSKQGKPGKAIAALRRALVIVPSNAGVHEDLAKLYAELGLHAAAIKHYQEAMRWIDAENTELLQELARSIEALSR